MGQSEGEADHGDRQNGDGNSHTADNEGHCSALLFRRGGVVAVVVVADVAIAPQNGGGSLQVSGGSIGSYGLRTPSTSNFDLSFVNDLFLPFGLNIYLVVG